MKCPPCNGGGRDPYTLEICIPCKGYGCVALVPAKAPEVKGPTVFFIRTGTPWSAHITLEELFTDLSDAVCICDPYYGIGSLLRLSLLRRCSPIRFLTQQPDHKEGQRLDRAIQEWKTEHGNTEFRCHQGRDLHDRFVLTNDELVLLGHGLKDIGNKDSFIVKIHSSLAPDLLETVRESFEAKWQGATVIA